VTLAVANVDSLVLQVPWPFLPNEIEISIHKNKKGKKNLIRLVLKKSLHDPWPKEFGGRSKWDINCFRPWRDIEENGTFEMHIETQFQMDYLLADKHLCKRTNASALDEVREIVRAIFYGHHRNSFYLFSIHDHLRGDEPVMHIRIQPPVRFSPLGSPLLLVSVIDHQLAKRLITQGKLDPEVNQSDFHRLITEGVSREVCAIRTSSTEELDLFRYALRVNSTRMRRSAWQSKNLPRYEDNPWMPTFISPLYSDLIVNMSLISQEPNEHFKSLTFLSQSGDTIECYLNPLIMCATCFVKKIQLKKCSRCLNIAYCSSRCQKQHWLAHTLKCVTSQSTLGY
jgi:hypothetical protein